MANEFKVKKGLIVDGSNTVVDVQGTQGQLFSVTDSLTGDLFSVSDVSGIPIFNVNSSGLSTFDGDISIAEKLIHSGDTNTYLQFPGTNDKIVFATNGSDHLTLDATPSATFAGTTKATTFLIGRTTAAGVGASLGDINGAELGPGYLSLSRNDTASAKQLVFEKNDVEHSYMQTESTNLRLVAGASKHIYIDTNNSVAGMWRFTNSGVFQWGAARGALTWDTNYAKVHAIGTDMELHLGSGNDSDAVKIIGSDATFAGTVKTPTLIIDDYGNSTASDADGWRLNSTSFFGQTDGVDKVSISSVTGTATFAGDVTVTGAFKDSSGDTGGSGQVLSSTGSGTNWINNDGEGVTGSGADNYLAIWNGTGAIDHDTDFYVDSNVLYTSALRITSDNNFFRETINSNTGGESWNSSNGWHRIIELTGGTGRGKCHFLIQTGGGTGTPCRIEAIVNTTWSNANATLSILHSSYPNFITDIRVVRNSTSGKSFVDIKGTGDDYVDVTILPDGSTNAALVNFTNVNSLPSGDSKQIEKTITNMIMSLATGTGADTSGEHPFQVKYEGSIFGNHMDMHTGNVVGKFAVMSTGIHSQYDFYNNGTSYFNGDVTIDANITQTTGTTANFSGNISSTTANFADNVYMLGGQLYLGASDATTNDSFRLYAASGQLVIASRESGTWTTRFDISDSGNATFGGHVKLASGKYLEYLGGGKLINMDIAGWTAGQQEHNILYSGWTSATGDYLSLKVAGNSTTDHGNLIIGDMGLWFGHMDATDNAQASDSSTNPHNTNGVNKFRVDNDGDATFAGNITSTGTVITLDSAGSAGYIADRANDTSGATYEYKTNGSLKWYTGLRGVSTEDFYIFNNAQGSTALLLNSSNNNATFASRIISSRAPGSNNTDPTLAFGNGNTGFYERSDDDLRVTVGGVNYWEFSANCMGNVNEGKAHLNSETATATNPSVIPWRNDSDTGIGRASADNLSLIAGGTETLRLGSNLATFNVGNSGATVFDVQGSNGQLFSVTDSLTGDLFSVSDVSGVPIFNVNSSGASTFDGNVSLTNGNLTIPEYIYHSGNTDAHIRFQNNRVGIYADFGTAGYIDLHDNGNVYIGASNSTALTITSSNASFTGGGTFQSAVTIDSDGAADNYYLNFSEAGSARFTIYENSNNVYFNGWAGHTIFRPRMAGSGSFAVTQGNTQFDTSGNATLAGSCTSTSFIKTGGTSSQFLMADGSVSTSSPQIVASASGNRWGVNAFVASDGVMEVGKYIDFHTSDGSTADHALRITANGTTAAFSAGITASSATFSSTVDMNATARFNFSANSHGSQFEAASAAQQTFRCDSDKFRIYMGSERFNVTNTGRVGINKATPAYTLDVNGSVSNISIYASHDVAAYSDARVKTDIETIPNALDKVNKLRGVTFKRTDEGSTDKRMMGVIAQEVLDVVPEVVNQRESDGHYSVSYGNMVGVLIEAVKELKAEVEELKKQIK